MKRRVLINTRCLLHPLTGVQRYCREIELRMPDAAKIEPPSVFAQGNRGHAWEQFVLPMRLNGATLFSPANTGPLAVRKQVVTIHDVSVLDHPEWFSSKFALWYQWLIPKLAKSAERIITGSEFSKERLQDKLGVECSKITVIPYGVNHGFISEVQNSEVSVQESRFFLYVGSVEPRKNLQTLVEAWKRAQLEGFELRIVGATGSSFQQVSLQGCDSIRFLGRVSDDELAKLYRRCWAFVYPSVYEGLGLPPLEAMTYGCPVMVSDIPAHHEACGEAATYFAATNIEELAGHLQEFSKIGLPERREKGSAGRARAALFRWETAAEKTWQVLSEVSEH